MILGVLLISGIFFQSPPYPSFIERHVAAFPQNPDLWSRLGVEYYKRGQATGSIADIYRARDCWLKARQFEGRTNAYYRQIIMLNTSVNLVSAYLNLNEPDLALVEAKRARAADPVSDLPWMVMGLVQWATGHREEAVSSYRNAVQINPSSVNVTQLRAAAGMIGDREGVQQAVAAAPKPEKDIAIPESYRPIILFALLLGAGLSIRYGVRVVRHGIKTGEWR